jgi:hypothetical protein
MELKPTVGVDAEKIKSLPNPPLRILEAFIWGEHHPDKWELLKTNMALREFLSYGFDKNKKFKLPEGRPDTYKVDPNPYAMTAVNLNNESRKLHIYLRDDLAPVRREMLFMGAVSGVTREEADVLFALKDQTLRDLYPNFPFDPLLKEWNIPVTVESTTKPEQATSPAKRRGRPPKNRL